MLYTKVAECQRQILEAGEMVEEAKRSLGINVDGIEDGDAFLEKENEEIDRSGPPLELNTGSFLSHAFDGAVYVSENLFLFVFASVGLDYCFKMKLLSPFPIKNSISR